MQFPTGIFFIPNKFIPTPTSKTPPTPATASDTPVLTDPPKPSANNVKNP